MLAGSAREIRIGTDNFVSEGEDGVKLDQLGRREQGARLSDLVDRLPGPFVIALDGAWGTGKSHFLQLWCGSHGKLFGKEGRVIHFDAFANDWQDDPLLGLTKAIAAEISFDDPTVVEMGKNALRVSARVLTATTLGAVKGLLGSDVVSEAVKAGADALGQISDQALTELWRAEEGRENAIRQFSAYLKSLAETHGKLILVIDELDRCRPDFALALLEIAKHAFAVPGVIFVLGVNLEALSHSVRKRYGAGVDAEVYLQRFVNMAFRLPDSGNDGAPAWQPFFAHRCAHAGVPTAVYKEALGLLMLVGPEKTPTLRDMSRLVSRLALLPTDLSNWSDGPRVIILSSAIAEVFYPGPLLKLRLSGDDAGPLLQGFGRTDDRNAKHRRDYLHKVWSVVTTSGDGTDALRNFAGSAFRAWSPAQVSLQDILGPTLDTFTLPDAPET